ncbi:30S ribosomal protein S1 [Carnobacteriaceae bacterium zg-ZUI252]|nr:30S ribosomal protein S1 [Carnobacteriaceae bacterium zg-ZUI252]
MSEFLDALNSTLEVNVGDLVQGEVITIQDNKQVIVGIVGAGVEGVIPAKELSATPIEALEDVVSVGDVLDLVVVSTIREKENDGGSFLLSKRRVDARKVWSDIEAKFENGELVEGTVKDVVKGGLVVDLGVRGFVPASLVSDRFVRDLSQFKGQTLTFQIVECIPAENKLVLSRKELVAAQKAEQLSKALSNIEVDTVVEGTVSRLTNFGAFIDLGGVDGLVHVSEISHAHVKNPASVLTVGDKVNVKVLSVDEQAGRVSLSIKATTKAPWEVAAEQIAQGDTVEGVVKRLTDFGAFVEVLPGVEGLVHVSQISHERVNVPNEVLTVGQTITALVQELRLAEQRMSLSMKALIERPVREVEQVDSQEDDFEYVADDTTVTLGDVLGDQLQVTE